MEIQIWPECIFTDNFQFGNGYYYKGNGQVYFAIVYSLEEIPSNSEMEKIGLFDSLPDELTYPILRDYFEIAEQKRSLLI